MHRKPLVIANWKMNLDLSQVERFFQQFTVSDDVLKKLEVILCATLVHLERVQRLVGSRAIAVGAQNVFWEDRGAFTGEVSALQLADFGCRYVLVGHSERREHFQETDGVVGKKVRQALQRGITPVICLGESYEEKEAGDTKRVVQNHVRACLEGFEPRDIAKVAIAYEPVWAISTNVHNVDGKADSPKSAQVVHKLIRRLVAEIATSTIAEDIGILYGGSVTPETVGGFAAMDDIDGVLVGGASKEAASFQKIVMEFIKQKKL
ncbi:MAG: triose-phosphate isomerase [Patescibacteria group bacterium]|nr:triose-phosphate isomerase [Patescibacteria group bacterium]MDD5715332.1 triose-phosphate isomerase [Patescibacteria group bacterium]